MAVVTAAFEKKYGVKVRVWRGSSENVVQRSVTEARGGRFDADVFETGGAAMESLHREKLLQKVKSPSQADLDPAALTAHGEWTGTRYNVFVAAYNTKLIKKDELPKSYDDLLDPKWKGKLGIEADDSDWFGAVIDQLGEERGLKLFRNIVGDQRHIGAQGPHLVDEPHHIGGSAARAHDLRLSGHAVEEQRRTGRLVRHPAHHRALRRRRRCAPRRTPERRNPVLRFHADGCAGTAARSRLFSGEPEGQTTAGRVFDDVTSTPPRAWTKIRSGVSITATRS